MPTKKLEQLEKRKKKIEAQIRQEKARENSKKRKDDTRRKVLVGSMVLAQVEKGEWPEDRLRKAMEEFLTRDQDRALFGLPPKGLT